MNKILKLPIFLGIVGGLCGGILALTNSVTADKISTAEVERLQNSYLLHFPDLVEVKDVDLDQTLIDAGITDKLYVYGTGDTYLGTIYTCSAIGFAGKSTPIKFTVSFKDGNYNHYSTLSHGETSSYGGKFINQLNKDDDCEILSNIDSLENTGATYTLKGIRKCVDACYSDYLSEYKDIK